MTIFTASIAGLRGPAGIEIDTPDDQLAGKLLQMTGPRKAIAVAGATPENALAASDAAAPTGSLLFGHRNKRVGDYLSLAYPPSAGLFCYGDSITVGYVEGIENDSERYITLLAAELGLSLNMRAIAGGSIMDWMQLQYADLVGADQVTTILPGFNDQRFVGEGASFQAGYRAALAAAVAWGAIADVDKIKGNNAKVTYTGTWTPTSVAPYTFGNYTQTQGDTAALPPIYGDTLRLCMLLQNNFGGVIDIEVDGSVVQTVNLIGGATIGVGNGGAITPVITYMPRLIRVTGLGPGRHDVVIRKTDATTTDGTGGCHFLWADSGLRSAETQPMVLLGDTLTMDDTGAALGAGTGSGYNNYTRLANAQFNQMARDVAMEAASDGLDVQFLETHRAWSPVDDPAADHTHPTAAGMASIAAMYARAARGVKDYGAATAGRLAAQQLGAETGGIAAAFQNGWTNLDATIYAPGGYSRDAAMRVHLTGMIATGTAAAQTTIFTLPEGYRPAKTAYFPVATFDAVFGCVRVLNTGEVQIMAGNNTWLSLDGVSFSAAA